VTPKARPPLPPGPYLVVGLARSGAGAARMLREHGEVIGVDSGDPPADVPGVEVHLRTDGLELLDRVRTVVKSPGVPREAPVVAEALARGIEVTGELELAWRLLPNQFIAVTGTNGKTTTVELAGAIHRAAGVPVAVAGNVGTPLSSLVGELDTDAVVVCESSSFQLEDSSAFAPDAAVLLNLAPDHLDRHRGEAEYRAAKMRAFASQDAGDVAVAPPELAGELPGAARRVTFGPPGADLSERGGALRWHDDEEVIAIDDIRLRGAHNVENAMAAAAVTLARGIPGAAVREALRGFAGVPHRLEEVAERDGVLYVNDSKATNVASARVGIEAFDGGVHAILGGSLKKEHFLGLRDPVTSQCVACYLIGKAADRLAVDLAGTAPLHRSGDLETAVREASAAAKPGEVILLSPACASYDQYRDFEERGEHFRRLATSAARE
jgi:UDP-N-acetylmuramoylalanine--D-glutamate ligase